MQMHDVDSVWRGARAPSQLYEYYVFS